MIVTVPFRLMLAGLAAASLAGCDGDNSFRITTTTSSSSGDEAKGVLRVVDALQCPDTLDVLTRKGSAAPGGGSCTYGGPRGSEVVLHLVPLGDRSAEAVLRDFERRASAEMPNAMVRIDARQTEDGEDIAEVKAPGVNIRARGDDATVSLPGIHIQTQGDNATVRIAGINIQARDGQGVRTEKTSVDVDGGQSTRIRTQSPGDATRMTFVLADDSREAGAWRKVGFEARGPAGGPLVIAMVRSKDQRDRVFDAAEELVALNVGN